MQTQEQESALRAKAKSAEQQITEMKGKNEKLTTDLDISKQNANRIALEVSLGPFGSLYFASCICLQFHVLRMLPSIALLHLLRGIIITEGVRSSYNLINLISPSSSGLIGQERVEQIVWNFLTKADFSVPGFILLFTLILSYMYLN